jgi:hypothetical protein
VLWPGRLASQTGCILAVHIPTRHCLSNSGPFCGAAFARAIAARRVSRGEAAAIPLAQQFGCRLLMNDRRAVDYARNINLWVLNVPDFVTRLLHSMPGE